MQLMVVLRKHPPQQGSRVSEARTREVAVVALRGARFLREVVVG